MKTIRKIIVRSCVLSYRVGKGGSNVPRISMIVTALFFIFVAVNISCNTLGTMNWYDWIFTSLFVLLCWLGFDWLGFSYFELWPVRFEELDDYQKYVFSRIKFHELTEDQAKEIVKIINDNPNWF
jgi:hypothetical protein